MAGTDPKHLAARLRTITRSANPTGGLPDAELVRRYAETRDEAAFEVLVWRHGPMVWGTCCRILRQQQDTEDAFQATFLALARSAQSLEGRESIAAWLHRVASNAALKVTTRRRPTAELPPDVPGEVPGTPADRELSGVIDQELGRLPDHYRVAFVLCCLEGLTNAEAARELGCPVGTVDSRLYAARTRLRDRLARRGFGPGALAGVTAVLTVPAAVSAATVGLGCSTTKPSPAVDRLAKQVGRTAPRSTATIGIASTVLAVTLAAAAVWAFGKPPPPQPEPIGPATAPAPHLRATGPTLLFTEMVPKPGESGSRILRLTRATFRGGKLTNREELHSADFSDFSPYARYWIVDGRYVVSESAVVYDLANKKLIYSFFGGKVAAIEGRAVYFHSLNVNRPEGVFRFDATTGVVEKVSDPGAGRWGLTGAVCPNGTKAIRLEMKAGVAVPLGGEFQHALVLDRVGKESAVLEGTFATTIGATGGGSFSFTPPGVWLDNDRFLTQTTLGKVVVLNTAEKKQEKVVDITLTHKPGEKAWDTIGASGFTPLGLQQPRFSLLPDGRVVYEADVVYFIDVTKKTWEKAAWRPLGHGFEYSAVPDKIEDVNRYTKTVTVTLRHKGKEIGKSESVWWTTAEKPRVVVTDEHLALIERVLQPGKWVSADSVKVWSATTGEWQTLDAWANSVIGWVK